MNRKREKKLFKINGALVTCGTTTASNLDLQKIIDYRENSLKR